MRKTVRRQLNTHSKVVIRVGVLCMITNREEATRSCTRWVEGDFSCGLPVQLICGKTSFAILLLEFSRWVQGVYGLDNERTSFRTAGTSEVI